MNINDEEIPFPPNDDPDLEKMWYDHLFPPKDYSVEPKEELVVCPRADKCISNCYHRKPHKYEAKYCDNELGECGVKCTHTLIADVTFFEDDFEIN